MDTMGHLTVDPADKSLRKCRKVLAFVERPPGTQSPNGIIVHNPDLAKAKEWAKQQANPIGGELTEPICQTKHDILDKGVQVDKVTEALLRGAHPEDGGGVGSAFQALGNGDCFINSVSTLIVRKGGRGDSKKTILRLAKKLRLAIVITGLRFMELFLGDQYDFFGDWGKDVEEVREGLEKSGWIVSVSEKEGLAVESRDTARLMFLRQLRHMSQPGVYTQQFALRHRDSIETRGGRRRQRPKTDAPRNL